MLVNDPYDFFNSHHATRKELANGTIEPEIIDIIASCLDLDPSCRPTI